MYITDQQIRNLINKKAKGKYSVGGSLYLHVSEKGSASWVWKYRLGGVEQSFTIGKYPQIKTEQAGLLRAEAKALVDKGLNPTHERKRKKAEILKARENTFELIARAWLTQKQHQWTLPYRKQIIRGFHQDIFPAIGKMPIGDIATSDIAPIIKRIVDRGAPTIARLTLQNCSKVFIFAIQEGRARENPALNCRGLVSVPKAINRRSLTKDELRDFALRLQEYGG